MYTLTFTNMHSYYSKALAENNTRTGKVQCATRLRFHFSSFNYDNIYIPTLNCNSKILFRNYESLDYDYPDNRYY